MMQTAIQTKTAFAPSRYQERIFDWIQTGSGSAQVGAVAGSGKTTTLVQSAGFLEGDAVFVAFNKHIAETLKTKLGRNCEARTLHSIGLETLTNAYGRMKLENRKYWEIYSIAGRALKPEEFSALPKLSDFARLTATPPDKESLSDMALDFNLRYSDRMAEAVLESLQWGLDHAKRNGVIDFTDMVWIPGVFNLPPKKQFDFVLADEAQDFNVSQRRLALSLMKPYGRLLAVGDEHQAIMQFAGADKRSWEAIAQETRARLLPLSICYRCPESHLKLAREIVPQIEAREGAPEGILDYVAKDTLSAKVRTGDLLLCRRTSPLISQCFRFIACGINARVRGRDIGKGLADIVKKIAKTPAAFANFEAQVSKWVDGEVSRLTLRGASDDAIQQAQDQAECMLICKSSFQAYSGLELSEKIQNIFSDDESPVMLSTIHRAKGLEAERVFILEPERLGVPRKHADLIAEQNLKYVALTRAKSEMYFVEGAAL